MIPPAGSLSRWATKAPLLLNKLKEDLITPAGRLLTRAKRVALAAHHLD